MDIKKFYKEQYKSDYVGRMPKWLEKEAIKESEIFKYFLSYLITFHPNYNLGIILDIGAGQLRIIDELYPFLSEKYIAQDIVMPSFFPAKNKYVMDIKRNIIEKSYIVGNITDDIETLHKVYNVYQEYPYLIISWGVDEHLSKYEFDLMFEKFKQMNTPYIIWQTIRLDTIKGLRLAWGERKITKSYRSIAFCKHYFKKNNFKLIEMKQTKVSNIYFIEG